MSTQVCQLPGQDTNLKLFPILLLLTLYDDTIGYTLPIFSSVSTLSLFNLNAEFFLTNISISSSLEKNLKIFSLEKNLKINKIREKMIIYVGK